MRSTVEFNVERFDTNPFKLSEEGQKLLKRYPNEFNEVLNFIKTLCGLRGKDVINYINSNPQYSHSHPGIEGTIISIPLGDTPLILKLYDKGWENGISDYDQYKKAKESGIFDTVNIYAVGESVLLMDKIPEGILSYNEFIKKYPHLEPEVRKALTGIKYKAGILAMDVGFTILPHQETRYSVEEIVEARKAGTMDTYISGYFPNMPLSQRYRFLFIDFLYENRDTVIKEIKEGKESGTKKRLHILLSQDPLSFI